MENDYSKELSLYLEMLRFSRGLTQEDFVFDIVSIRQYRRYLSGVSKIPQDIINQLAKRLGIKSEHIILEFEKAKIDETKRVTSFYNAIINYDYEGADVVLEKIDPSNIIDANNRKLYLHATYIKDYRDKKLSELQLLDQLKELLDYPSILSKQALSFSEIILMSAFLGYKSFDNRQAIADRLVDIVSNESQIISGYNERVRFLCLQRLSHYYGAQGKYKTVIELSTFAIKHLVQIKSYYLMDFFYYFKALAYHHLGDIEHCKENLYYCHAILNAENIPSKIEKFKKKVKADMRFDLDEVALDWLRDHIIRPSQTKV